MAALGRELMRSLAGADVVPRLIADRPEEWRLGALTIVIAGGRARLRYARQPIGSTPARAADIAEAWRRAIERLRSRSLAPDELLPRLHDAYARLAKRPGDRVPLADVRAALGISTRAQFAWDLARLRSERRLAFGELRVDLGVATGHATTRRSRVVWIEDDTGSGAFYESVRFILQESRP